ncbi:hypothetical protein GCWU000324_01422 [Kingella oralis ATCC 51147]|uniref:Uncharacterized protein n=1 Tax=Kingella oralis ATCC 51147 TaxID=629741 RepID=C4GH03_9NEIS|nr:hypothetical protein GCWU000324_01422 [Kingella oralis ATCC 51147]
MRFLQLLSKRNIKRFKIYIYFLLGFSGWLYAFSSVGLTTIPVKML